MKKVISTIVALGFISSMLVSSAYAGHDHIEVLNPLWLPVAILSTVATIVQAPFIYGNRGYSESRQAVIYEEPRNHRQVRYYERGPAGYSVPRQTVIYEEPRQYRHANYYERGPANHYYGERGRGYDAPRYREYR
jgi:hypothetical protein